MKGHEMGKNPYFTDLTTEESGIWKGGASLLSNLDMELTERCNNNCIHCCINLPADDREAMERELSTEDIKDILKEVAALGCLGVRFTGGEPLLREDFEELYLFARRLGLRVLIFTNGTLITPNLAQLFAHIRPLRKIEITVYGMKKKSYEAVTRNPGSFEVAWRGINLLLENKVPFVVKGALLPPNKEEMEEFAEWASTLTWMDVPPSYSMFFNLRCRRDSEEKDRLIKRLRISPEEALETLTRRPNEYFEAVRSFSSRFMRPPGSTLFSCGAGYRRGCVDAYGYFQPCLLLKHPDTAYNLRNGSLKDALTSFFPKVRETKATNPDYLARCARCFLKSFCEQCPAKSWTEHGKLDTPVEYLCEAAHAQARYVGLLKNGEMAWEVSDWEERIKSLPDKAPTQSQKAFDQ